MARIHTIQGAVGDTLTIESLEPHYNQTHVAANYFSDSSLTTPVTPTGGTIAVTGRPNGAGGYGPLDMSPLDCTDTSDFATASVPLDAIQFTPSGIAGATHYKITVTAKAM